ncbi:bidirectional sugar transporter N3-like [Impatiens glandulifera]|uniref:bidirectional sugar transporter N3-like n=1 Tax=Impatiens glandulifera TaxID=253017 RepID=UPI001FB115A4|nr:bidirectional sugar transporter N3-like [Impatiens glandulifera]
MEIHSLLVLIFGILGNVVSVGVYLSPLFTFVEIYKKKSTMRFKVLPYVLALFSASVWLFYAILTTRAVLLLSINIFGCVIETIYITIFIYYARRQIKRKTIKLVLCLNVGVFTAILLSTLFLVPSSFRGTVVGWICVSLFVLVFAAPLSIAFEVVKTRSVEFMPFTLSFSLTISAIVWFVYGILLTDLLVSLPNVIGLLLGIVQMILYGIYRNKKTIVEEEDLTEVAVVQNAGDHEPQVIQSDTVEVEEEMSVVISTGAQDEVDQVEEEMSGAQEIIDEVDHVEEEMSVVIISGDQEIVDEVDD